MAEWYDGDPKLSTLFPVACPTCPEEEEQIVDELARDVQPRGVIVYVEAEPFCTQARGVREVISRTGMLGTHRAYNKNPHLADEFRLLIERHPAIRTVA